MRVLLTGASGCLAAPLLVRLCNTPAITAIFGVDVRPSSFTHPKYQFHLTDIRTNQTSDLLRAVDAVIHLAFRLTPGTYGIEEMRSNNVDGTLSFLEKANTAGVKNFINLSSVSVYGNGLLLTESAALNPSIHFPYAIHKAKIDEVVRSNFPEVTTLRAHYIVGPNSQRFLNNLAASRIYITYPSASPIWQLIHEDDVVEAILLTLLNRTKGFFNLAGNTPYSLDTLFRSPDRMQIPLTMPMIQRLWKMWLLFNPGARGGWLNTAVNLIDTTLTVDCTAIRSVGWEPKYDGDRLKAILLS